MLCHVSLNNKSFTWCTEFYYRDNSPITSYNLKTQLPWALSIFLEGSKYSHRLGKPIYNLWNSWSSSGFQRKKGKCPYLFFCGLLPRNCTKYHAVVLLLIYRVFFLVFFWFGLAWVFFGFFFVGCGFFVSLGFGFCCCFWLFNPQKLILRHIPVIPTHSGCDKSNTISAFAFWSTYVLDWDRTVNPVNWTQKGFLSQLGENEP